MPSVFDKRKSRNFENGSEETLANVQAVFRQHFEAQFKPLPGLQPPRPDRPSEDEDGRTELSASESEWEGISDDETSDANHIEIVDHSTTSHPTTVAIMTRGEFKAFMSPRPPTVSNSSNTTRPSKRVAPAGEEDSAAFLRKDIELQRLISESHILSAAGANPSHYQSGGASWLTSFHEPTSKAQHLFTEGRTRRLITDMRVQTLLGSSKAKSIQAQANLPMAIRRGMKTAAEGREAKRRRDARENGIVLEAPVKGMKRLRSVPSQRRGAEARVDMPGVGRMRGAKLKLSRRDVMAIQGPRRPERRGRKSRGR